MFFSHFVYFSAYFAGVTVYTTMPLEEDVVRIKKKLEKMMSKEATVSFIWQFLPAQTEILPEIG